MSNIEWARARIKERSERARRKWYDAGSSRTISPYLKCAILIRDRIKCVYCKRKLRLDWHSVDHLNNERNPREVKGTNTETNLVSCCPDCNTKRYGSLDRFKEYLHSERRVVPKASLARAERAISIPIDRKSRATRKLAAQWYGDRIDYLNSSGRKRAEESYARRIIMASLRRVFLDECSEEDLHATRAAGLVDSSGNITDAGEAAFDAAVRNHDRRAKVNADEEIGF